MAEYTIDSNGVLRGVTLEGETSITLPSDVREIGEFVFTEDISIQSLTLDNNCRKIRNKAFYNNKTLKSLTIGSSLETIEPYAFAGSNPLEAVHGSNSHFYSSLNGWLCNISGKIVLGINKDEVDLTGIAEVCERAFSFCGGIKRIVFPNSDVLIGDYAFSDCNGLKSLTIPGDVTKIGYGAFFGCGGIERLSIQKKVDSQTGKVVAQKILGLGFANMENLLIVQMTDSVVSIGSVLGEETFSDGGRKLRLDGDIESLSEDVASHWYGTYGELPTSVALRFYINASWDPVYETEVAPGTTLASSIAAANAAVAGVYRINGWYYDDGLSLAASSDSVVENYRRGDNGQVVDVSEINLYADYDVVIDFSTVYETEETGGKVTLVGVKDWDALKLSGYKIPDSFTYQSNVYEVTALGAGLFAGGELGATMTIPKTIRNIGKEAFRGCTGMTSVEFEEGSKCSIINALAFAETELTSMTLPDSVKTIRKGAFYGCGSLSSIYLGEKVNDIGTESGNVYGTFEDCDSLVEVRIGSVEQWLGISFGNSACNPVGNGAGLFIGDDELPLSSLTDSNIGSATEIKPFAFTGCSSIAYLDLDGTDIEAIGEEAFSACSSLSSVDIVNGKVATLGRAAFSNCGAITEITVPGTLTSIGGYAFNACVNLEYATVEDGVPVISNSMFSYCIKLEEISLPASVHSIGTSAFSGDVALTKATFGARCSFGDYAFYNCTALSEIYFTYQLNNNFGTKVFEKCPNITKVHGVLSGFDLLPLFEASKGSIEEIGVIGNDSKYLTGGMSSDLQQFTNLSRIVIPDGIEYIDEGYFDDVIFVGDTEPPTLFNNIAVEINPSGAYGPSYYVVDKWIVARYGEPDSSVQSVDLTFSNVGLVIRGIAENVKVNAESSFTLPDTLCRGCNNAFYTDGEEDIDYWDEVPFVGKGVTVSIDNVQTFASGSFDLTFSTPLIFGASLVANGVDIIDEVQDGVAKQTLIINADMGYGASFSGCTSITDLDLGEDMTYIPDWAFNYCSSLKRIIFRGGGINFQWNPFDRCDSLGQSGSGIYAQSIAAWCGCSGFGNPLGMAHNLYIYDSSTGVYNLLVNAAIPIGVDSIGDYAFAGATCLQMLSVPNSVTSIGPGAFLGCSNLTSATLGNGITVIGGATFSGCTSLASINIPSSVTRVADNAFDGDFALFDTTTISGVRLVDGWACGHESGLTGSLNLSSVDGIADRAFMETGITAVTIGGIATIPQGAFSKCPNLASVAFSSGTVTIEEAAFYECTSLTSITIPSTVKTLGYAAFGGCESVSSITIGSGVEVIEEECFAYTAATSLVVPNSVHTLHSLAFGWMFELTRVDLGTGLQNIEHYVFNGDYNLETVVFHGAKPQNALDDCLDGINSTCSFYFEHGAAGWVDGEEWCGHVFHEYPSS